MGCKIECSICCKKKKKIENTLPIERKDTKFVAESYQHVKIEIKNNENSNSKDIPLINNFFTETLGRQMKANSINSQSNNSKKSGVIKDFTKSKEINDNKEIKENKDNKETESKVQIQNLVTENLYKGNSEKISEEHINKDAQSEKSKKTEKNKEKK